MLLEPPQGEVQAFEVLSASDGELLELRDLGAPDVVAIPVRGHWSAAGRDLVNGLPQQLTSSQRQLRCEAAGLIVVAHAQWLGFPGDSGVFTVLPAPAAIQRWVSSPVICREPGAAIVSSSDNSQLVWMAGEWRSGARRYGPGSFTELAPGERLELEALTPGYLLHTTGIWDSGAQPGDSSAHRPGMAVDYPTYTMFDAHHHDCDEYWIVLEGGAEVVSGGRRWRVGQGDVVYTPMGDVHDIPVVEGWLHGVYVEGGLRGAARRGHLHSAPPQRKAFA